MRQVNLKYYTSKNIIFEFLEILYSVRILIEQFMQLFISCLFI